MGDSNGTGRLAQGERLDVISPPCDYCGAPLILSMVVATEEVVAACERCGLCWPLAEVLMVARRRARRIRLAQ